MANWHVSYRQLPYHMVIGFSASLKALISPPCLSKFRSHLLLEAIPKFCNLWSQLCLALDPDTHFFFFFFKLGECDFDPIQSWTKALNMTQLGSYIFTDALNDTQLCLVNYPSL